MSSYGPDRKKRRRGPPPPYAPVVVAAMETAGAGTASYHASPAQRMTDMTLYRAMQPYEPSQAMVSRAVRAGNVRTGGLLGIDLKFVDQVFGAAALVATWNGSGIDPGAGANALGTCTQGSGESQRDGNRVCVKSIHIQGCVVRGAAAGAAAARAGNVVQVSLVMDRQSNGQQLSGEDVYVATDPEVPGRRVIANSSRFKILKTWTIVMSDPCAFNDAAATGAVSGVVVPFNGYVKMNQTVNYGANNGTIADCKDVSFHMIAACRDAAAGDVIEYNSRVRFVG